MNTQLLTRHQTDQGSRWAFKGKFLPPSLPLNVLLQIPHVSLLPALESMVTPEPATGTFLAPIEPNQEVWGAGVTYLDSRKARREESLTGDIYDRVYSAKRPELFFKAVGWRVAGPEQPVRVRKDCAWNVPEPELVLLINCFGEIVGYTAGNDLTSRDIEGENPLYLPQAKIYRGACSLGPGIRLLHPTETCSASIKLEIFRNGLEIFRGETNTSSMKRSFHELAQFLFLEMDFPQGVFLMTGTGIIPENDFTLLSGDLIRIRINGQVLENEVII